MSAKAAKRELAEALRGYPWERWSTRSVVWAVAMFERAERERRATTTRDRLYLLDYALRSRRTSGMGIHRMVVRLESAAYLWEHSREPDHPIAGTLTSVPAGTVDE